MTKPSSLLAKPMKTPENGAVDIWFCDPSTITEPLLLNQYQQLLPENETAKYQRYRFQKDQHAGLITRAFIRSVLSCYGAKMPDQWQFILGEKDKPSLLDNPQSLQFNLSHTDGLLAAAITCNNAVGFDVENTTRSNDVLAIADRYFSNLELQELQSLPKSEQVSRFFDYWTLKESYIKAVGLGLAIPLDDFSFILKKNSISLAFHNGRNDNPENWHSQLFYPNSTHRCALTTNNTGKPPQLRFFQHTPLLQPSELNRFRF